jgi:putative ABC transport system permease protein
MRFLPYLASHLRSRSLRTLGTVAALALCVFLFCTLEAFLGAVQYSLKTVDASRLVARHRVSLMFPLPLAYREQIGRVPGVKRVAAMHFFGGSRKTATSSDFFTNFAVDAEAWLSMTPEIVLPGPARRAFLSDPRGAIVGRRTAERFGWKVGDAFQLESFIPPFQVGRPWDFVLSGIFDEDKGRGSGTDTNAMYFHFSRLYEATKGSFGVGNYAIQVDDPARASEVAGAIDRLFENGTAQTFTQTESAFRAGLVSAAGDLAPLLRGVALAVMFAVLLVVANTMSMAVRERRREIGVLKTLGFSDLGVMALVAAEAVLIGAAAGTLGIALSAAAVSGLSALPFLGDAVRAYPDLSLSAPLAGAGLAAALSVSGLAGVVPALLAFRIRVAEALRTI